MSEPWLSDLSEDWKTPSSIDASSLPNRPPNPTTTASASPAASRIPRPTKNLNAPVSVRNKARPTSASSRITLSERSRSDINIPSYSSSASRQAKPVSRPSRSSSASSAASVVKLDTAARKAKSSSPVKAKSGTPEWRKIVMKGQNNPAQKNLFSPMGLEGIFQKPSSAANDDPPKPRQNFSFLQDLESMPSSPPPWPKSHRGLHNPVKVSSQGRPEDNLGILREQDEDEIDRTGITSSVVVHDSGDGHTPPLASEEYGLPNQTGSTPRLEDSSDSELRLHDGENQVSDRERSHLAHGSEAADLDLSVQKERSSASGNASSVVSGFSPVFISKHNTADGRIDYAALDLSNPEVLEKLKESLGFRNSTASAKGLDRECVGPIVSDDLPSLPGLKNSVNQSSLAPISEFVRMERGGHSEEGSFMLRPLSPSASSSIVPSDSVSQVHAAENKTHRPVTGSSSRDQEHSPADRESLSAQSPTLDTRDLNGNQIESMRQAVSAVEFNTDVNLFVPGGSAVRSATEDESSVQDPALDTLSHEGSGATGSIETVLRRSNSDQNNQDVAMSVSAQPIGGSVTAGHFQEVDSESDSEIERPRTPLHAPERTFESSPNKRTAPLLSKSPTPKRIRTLSELERGQYAEYVSDVVEEQHRRMQAIIGKRKDARYDDCHEPCDPEALARREILRPRNLSQAQHVHAESNDAFRESLNSTLKTVQEHINQVALDCDASEDAKIKALTSEVATMQIRCFQGGNGEVRKNSVSTQDYVDEAMKIMELIRSNRMPRSELSNLEESESELIAPMDETNAEDLTPQTISRPPSREGVVNAWRTRDSQPLNANVASQLERYQEIGDESFVATSAFEDLQDSAGGVQKEHDQAPVDEESANIRIYGHLRPTKERDEVNLDAVKEESPQPQSPGKTYGSNRSTDSSGRTVETTSTQKTRTLPVIGPDRVSHLLRAEEAGMRYDPERQTWIKCKSAESRLDTRGDFSSSTCTEDDPFGAISDLSVNDGKPDYPSVYPSLHDRPRPGNSEPQVDLESGPKDDDHHDRDAVETREENLSLDMINTLPIDCEYRVRTSVEPQNVPSNEELADEIHRTGPLPSSNHYLEGVSEAYENAPTPLDRLAKVPTESVRSKRRNVSVLFSSPPVAHQYEPQHWSDQSGHSDVDESIYKKPYNRYSNTNWIDSKRTWLAGASPNQGTKRGESAFSPFHRELSLPCINEHHEISFVGTGTNGRSMSLTLSVSTPLPSHRHNSRPVLQSSGLRNSSIWHSLSPLSEFSFHQDDSRHLRARKLSEGENHQLIVPNRINTPAVVVETLVQKLTDVEPDEPYWDFMRALHLERKDLENLYMLDEFCPRIEELDVSENALQHLNGAPIGIRYLDVRNNRLSNLSSLEHLANLQYLDISGNGIESLEAFSNLVHLRELKVNDNNVSSLEGLLDLDGLLSLSLKRNKLVSVDFQGTEMKRLSKLNADDNSLQQLLNVQCLPALTHLRLDDNQLIRFPCRDDDDYQCHELQSLHMARNRLEYLDVALFPNLCYLDVDENNLARIDQIEKLQHVLSICARSQKPSSHYPTVTIADSLDDFSEIHHLYLSGNLIPNPAITAPFLNLKTLELAFAGVQSLPPKFGSLTPNLRLVNLNSNGLKDLRPLRGIKKLHKLFVAANRLSRLRKTLRVLGTLPLLQEVDLRDNPLTLGYYPLIHSYSSKDENKILMLRGSPPGDDEHNGTKLQHLLPSVSENDHEVDLLHVARLDEETRLRKRVHEILLAAKCPKLELADGRRFNRDRVFTVDETWEQLVKLGVVERVDGDNDEMQLGDAQGKD